MSDPHWIEKATAKMKKKGTLGSFGKATPSKISRAKKEGGVMAKKAIFAENVSRSNVKQHFADGMEHMPEDRRKHYQIGNAVDGRMNGMTDGVC